jgi:hypothetical protein
VTRARNITIALAALCALAVAAPAAYALDNDYHHVIRECYDTGQLPAGKYTRHALLQARRHLPSDIKEYSDCEDLINNALAAQSRHGGGTGSGGPGGGAGGGGATPPPNPALTTPSGAVASSSSDFNALKAATDPKTRSSAPPEVPIAGHKQTPTVGGVINAARHANANDLPLPLLLSLVALAAMAALGAAAIVRQGWPETRRAALRLLRR